MTSSEFVCPVCLREDVGTKRIESAVPRSGGTTLDNITHSDDAIKFECAICGRFVVTECDYVNLRTESQSGVWERYQFSALIQEQTIRKLPPFWIQCGMDPYGPLNWIDLTPIAVKELLGRWPRTVAERIDRTLCNLVHLSEAGGDRINLVDGDVSVAFAKSTDEARFYIRALDSSVLVENTHAPGHLAFDLAVTPHGWARFEELTRGSSNIENPAFVAMWFGGGDEKTSMDDAFNKALGPAVVSAGYRVTRADKAEHNDWIMDKILGDIRIAPFIIADFTGHRRGVYFEAGFARGLGLPVINTCRSDHFDDAHFDTKQLNHIVWETLDELRERVFNRIVGSIGRGPHTVDK